MKLRFFLIPLSAIILLFSCSGNKNQAEQEVASEPEEESLVAYVDLTDPLDMDLVTQGYNIFKVKCSSCHTLDTTQFLVPAFAGVTNRRSPEWIMNMILNVDKMVVRDSTARALLKKHKIKMPDPDLDVEEARAVLEFLRDNDVKHVGEKDQGVQQ